MKYHNTKVFIDDKWFASKKEGNRYLELKLLEKQGKITDLQLQVPFVLQPRFKFNGKVIRPITYVCDFTYKLNGVSIVEDVKGIKTEVYKLKKKMFIYQYGIDINEI